MIRTIVQGDVPAIVKIAEAVRLDTQAPQPHILNQGFLVYVLNDSGYRRRANPLFTVSVENGAVAGFLMCYDSTFLRRLVADGLISHQDGAVSFLLEKDKQSFIFGDQIAVKPKTTRRGIGRDLLRDMFRRMHNAGIHRMFVTILHQPVRNTASIQFCKRLGARCVQEVKNRDGLTWGVYLFEP